MDNVLTSTIPISTKVNKSFEQPASDDDEHEGYDLFMGILELSVSLGNFNHNVAKSVEFIKEHNTPSSNSFELVLLNDFRIQFEQLQKGTDIEERTLHETRGDLFIRLYKELVDIELDEEKRYGYLKLCYELFDSGQPKLKGREKSFSYRLELIDGLYAQVQNILHRLDGNTRTSSDLDLRSSDSLINMYLECIKMKNVDSMESFGLRKEITCPLKELRSDQRIAKTSEVIIEMKIEDYYWIEVGNAISTCVSRGFRFEKGISVITDQLMTSEQAPRNPTGFLDELTANENNSNNRSEKEQVKFEVSSQNDTENNFLNAPEEIPICNLGSLAVDIYEYISDDLTAVNNISIAVSNSFDDYKSLSKKKASSDLRFANGLANVTSHTRTHELVMTSEHFLDGYLIPVDRKVKDIKTLINEEAASLKSFENNTLYAPENVFIEIPELDLSNLSEDETFYDFNISDESAASVTVNYDPTESQTDVSIRSTVCFDTPNGHSEKCSLKDEFEIPISDNCSISPLTSFRHKISQGSENNCDSQDSHSHLETIKEIYAKYRNSHQRITEVEEKKDLETLKSFSLLSVTEKSRSLNNTNKKGTSQKNNSRLQKTPKEVDSSEEEIMTQLRQTVSDIKLSLLKKVDKSLEFTLPKPSDVLLRKPSTDKVKSEQKNYGRNSKFTDELRLNSPKKTSPRINISKDPSKKKFNKSGIKQDDQEKLSPKLSPITQTIGVTEQLVLKEVDRSLSDVSGKNQTKALIKKEINRKDVVKNDSPKMFISKSDDREDIKSPSHRLSFAASNTCCLVKDDLNNNLTPEKLNESDDQEILSPIISQISKTVSEVKLHILKEVDKTLSEVTGKNHTDKVRFDKKRNHKDVVKIDTLKMHMTYSDDSEDLKSKDPSIELTPRNVNEFVAEQDEQDMFSPILSQIVRTVSDVKLNILKEVDKSLSELSLRSASNVLLKHPSEENLSTGTLSFADESNLSIDNRKELVKSDVKMDFEILDKPVLESLCLKERKYEKLVKSDGKMDVKVNSVKTLSKLSFVTNKDRFDPESLSFTDDLKEPSAKTISQECESRQSFKKKVDTFFHEVFNLDQGHWNGSDNFEASFDEIQFNKEQRSFTTPLPKWQHQRHVIAAPRVVIKTFKSNPAYEWSPHDPNAPDFYEQLDQFFEIRGQQNSGLAEDSDGPSIESRVSLIIDNIRKEMPRDISYYGWMDAVGKFKLGQLLTREEKSAYESVRWQSRDRGDQDLSAESRFTDALHGMIGYESPHLKASSLTGLLQLRSPLHQESISESYLLVSLGHLGYLYQSLKDQLVILDQKGATAAALRSCLQKDLLIFHQFYDSRKKKPSSLLFLHRKTRQFQVHFQWLLDVLQKVQNEKSIVVSLYEESGRRVGSQKDLMIKWLKVVSKPLIKKLYRWLHWGQLRVFDCEEFLIERCLTSTIDDFWQKRYRLTKSFSRFFDHHLSETLISVGKTLAFSKKYLGLKIELNIIHKKLQSSLLEAFEKFFKYGDQETLYEVVQDLHSLVSNMVLSHLRENDLNPEDIFFSFTNT
uniref:Uncharacterized protein LOC108052726 n=1 Tax=Drosophila rhopaloa TaxID=1041015 RepID=A0A6P4FSQ6_DRORH